MQFNLEIIFVNSYEFLSFTQNVGKNICKITSENLSKKYEQKMHLKLLQKKQSKKQLKELVI